MTAFKGTPGPWQLSSESPTIIKQDMSLIGLPDGGVLIGSACGHESSGFFPTNEQAISNARLIAAAPELLSCLDMTAHGLEVASRVVGGDLGAVFSDRAMSARDAIAKATGGAA